MGKKEKKCSREEEEEIVKAAAWAWYLHGAGATTRPVKESNPRGARSVARPSRFKIESQDLSHSPCPPVRRRRSMSADACGDFRGAGRVFTRSSLLDAYEMAVLSRQLESGLSDFISKPATRMSEKSWIDRGISGDLCNSSPPKVSRFYKAKRVPAMCGSSSVFVPGEMESVRKSPQHQHKKWQSGLLSGLARKVLFLSEFYIK